MVREIPLTKGQVTLVDDEDYALISRFKWHAELIRGKWYARRKITMADGQKRNQSLHQFLLPVPSDQTVDHINGDGLDNRRANLRPATRLQQMHNLKRRSDNTSGYVGVTWSKVSAKWAAQVTIRRQHIHLGLFDSAIEAARAYDHVVRMSRGEFVRVNFPEKQTEAAA